jgi:hypothetical protein
MLFNKAEPTPNKVIAHAFVVNAVKKTTPSIDFDPLALLENRLIWILLAS